MKKKIILSVLAIFILLNMNIVSAEEGGKKLELAEDNKFNELVEKAKQKIENSPRINRAIDKLERLMTKNTTEIMFFVSVYLTFLTIGLVLSPLTFTIRLLFGDNGCCVWAEFLYLILIPVTLPCTNYMAIMSLLNDDYNLRMEYEDYIQEYGWLGFWFSEKFQELQTIAVNRGYFNDAQDKIFQLLTFFMYYPDNYDKSEHIGGRYFTNHIDTYSINSTPSFFSFEV